MHWSIFAFCGLSIIAYALYLVHLKVEIQVGQSIVLLTGVVVVFFPLLRVEYKPDGGVVFALRELSENIGNTTEGAEAAINGVQDLQSRLQSALAAVDRRLQVLEGTASIATPNNTSKLEEYATPDPAVREKLDQGLLKLDRSKELQFELLRRERLPIF